MGKLTRWILASRLGDKPEAIYSTEEGRLWHTWGTFPKTMGQRTVWLPNPDLKKKIKERGLTMHEPPTKIDNSGEWYAAAQQYHAGLLKAPTAA